MKAIYGTDILGLTLLNLIFKLREGGRDSFSWYCSLNDVLEQHWGKVFELEFYNCFLKLIDLAWLGYLSFKFAEFIQWTGR